jgi:hypothetical protein
MNVYKRPLFMQQGGMARVPVPTPPAAMRPATAPSGAMPPMRPASAPMGAPGAPPRPPAQDVAGIASMVSQKGQMELDQAQGPEQIINAFRGNQKPLEARYQELAQYVGPQDAAATPLSVLTMVQPSLMMTAKGASESGIGELMANVAGGVNMESAPGQPNRMGQGLGNLMMSRQAPQPAGMAQGGVVGKFKEGGNPLVEYYKQDLPAFQEILAPSQGDKDAAKRQLFFDIAQRGLAMAGGAGGTGNVASQLANVFQTLPGTYAAQQAELRKGERAAQQAALQSASGRLQAQREQQAKAAESSAEASRRQGEAYQKFIYDMTLANNEAMLEAKNKGEEFEGVSVVDPKGTQLAVLNTLSPTFESDLAEIRKTNPGAQVVKIPDQKDLFPTASDTFSNAAANAIFNRSDLRQALLTGQNPVSAEDLDTLNQAIVMNTKPQLRRVQNPETLQMEDITVPTKLSDPWDDAILAAANRGLDVQVPDYLKPQLSGSLEPSPPVSTEPGTEEQAPGLGPVSAEFTGEEQAIVDQIPDIDDSAFVDWNPADSFGTQAQFDAFVNSVVPKVANFFTGSEAGAGSPAEIRAESSINALNAFILQTLFSAASGTDNKLAEDERNIFRALIPERGTPAQLAANQYERINDEFLNLIRQKEQELNEPQANFSTKQKIRQQIVELQSRSRQVSELSSSIRAGISGRPPISEMDLNSLQQQYIRGPVRRVQ